MVYACMSIAENIAQIHERMNAAARRTGRDPNEIFLMAVSKTYPAERIHEAYQSGVRLFGENRVQEFTDKVGSLTSLADASFHLIGHLQSNKAAKATELFSCVESVDSLRLAQKLNATAGQLGKKLEILIEINVGGEAVKSGMPPQSPELEAFLKAAPELSNLEVRGLMTIP